MTLSIGRRLYFLARRTWIVARRQQLDRSTKNVVDEYDRGWIEYGRFLDRAKSIDDWLTIPDIERSITYCNIDGRLSYEKFDSTGFYRQTLLDALKRYFPEVRSITEFGSGVGRNLLFLKRALPKLDVYGYELCRPGVDVSVRGANKFGIEAGYAQLDYIEDGPEKFVHPVTDVAFTMFSLEQIPTKGAQALKNILSRVRLGSLHIEPVPENYPRTIRGILGRIEHAKVNYLGDFDRMARGLESCSVSVESVVSAHNPLMFPSLYILRKKDNAT
jgi:hypothetical protein